MLNVPNKVRIFLCRSAIDMRKGFDGLHGVVLEVLRHDPLSGDLFVFLNKRRDRVKLLIWDGDARPRLERVARRICHEKKSCWTCRQRSGLAIAAASRW